MFSSSSSSSSSVSPFQPYFPLSSSNNYHPPPPCVNLETCTGDIFLHHIHDHLSGQCSLHNASMAPPSHQTMTNQGVSSNTVLPSINASLSSSSCGDHHQYHNYYGNINNGNLPYFPHYSKEDVVVPSTKKDRHSKIFTAQGFRDRRVRLSINVARQFFDLQDLLGFDKASKTLEWLLTKSKKAIKQLGTGSKHLSWDSVPSKSLSSSSECDDVVSDINEEENHVTSKDKEMMMKLKESESGVRVAKESRAKARERARERTREKKMCTTSRRPQILNQLELFNEQHDDHETISFSSKVNFGDRHMNQELGSLLANQVHHHHEEDHESVVVERNKLKSFQVYSNYNQQKYLNVMPAESTDDQSSNSQSQFLNASSNWDINGAFSSPNINCAITNINLATGI